MTSLWIKHMWKVCKIFPNILTATHFKINAKRHMIIIYEKYHIHTSSHWYFSTTHWFSIASPGKMSFFEANIKFNYFSRHDLNSLTFTGLYEPWLIVISKLMTQYLSKLGNLKERLCQVQGAVSIRKTVLPAMAIPMLKIRRPNGRLIFNMEIAIRR